jgi:hypothetical protein
MPRKTVAVALAVLLLYLAPAPPAAAGQSSVDGSQIAKIKSDVAKRGVGDKAKVAVSLRNKTSVKGYIKQASEDQFVIADDKTNAETTIAYRDVEK